MLQLKMRKVCSLHMTQFQHSGGKIQPMLEKIELIFFPKKLSNTRVGNNVE